MDLHHRRPAPGLVTALLLIAFLGLPITSGCSAPRRARVMEKLDSACFDTHLERVLQRRQGHGVAGSGKVRFVSTEGRGRASFDFVFRRPDGLRLQFRSPLGPVVAVLDIVGDRYLFADFGQGLYLQGVAGDGQFAALTGLPLAPRTLISVLLAEPLPGESGISLTGFDPHTCLPAGCRVGGGVEVAYHHEAGQMLPARVVLEGPGSEQKTTIRFRDLRPLTEAERSGEPPPVETHGLHRGQLLQTDPGLPLWIGQ